MPEINLLVKGKVLAYYSENKYVYYKKGMLYLYDGKHNKITNLENNLFKRILSKFSIFRRLFRLEPRSAIKLNENEILFTCQGFIFNLNFNNKILKKEHKFRPGMTSPLYLTKYQDNDGNLKVIYGEYFSNKAGDKVSIYKRNGNLWHKIYTFKKGTIKHIHNIIYDEDNNYFYIFTGDDDIESGIWKADCDFTSVNLIRGGKQIYRSCFGAIINKHLIYATDTPLEQNYLLSLNLETYEIEKISKIKGPVIYGARSSDKIIFSTTVEPDSNIKGIRYLITKKRGKGVLDDCSYLYTYSIKEKLSIVLSIKKDFLPVGLFQFGTFQPITYSSEIIAYNMGLKKYKNTTIKFGGK